MLTIIILLSCATELNSFNSVCRNCLLIHGTNFTSCVSMSASQFETNYGLLMLSRKKFTNTKASPYNPASQFKGYLEATVSNTTTILLSFLLSFLIPHRYLLYNYIECALYTQEQEVYDF